MSKEVEEAIQRLNGIDIKFFLAGSMEQSNYVIETADKVNKAIETVLNCIKELESKLSDSTPNEAIREKIADLKLSGGSNGKDEIESQIRELTIENLEQILEGEKK